MPTPPWFDHLPGSTDGSDILLLVDHAGAAVPPDVALGIPDALLTAHIAVDIGADPLARALAVRLGAAAFLATLSRLVVDLNRDPDDPRAIPAASDGHAIPGNTGLSVAARQARLDRFWAPYHAAIAADIAAARPALIVAVHSFTPALAQGGEPRPWPVGLLYNRDDRAARIALSLLAEAGFTVGDNQPYSGKLLNATMNRHAEAHAIPYLALEIRNDGLADAAGIARWAEILAPIIAIVRNRLA
ncbi:N-formylglutamate amidohydrolase [Sphingomonas flavalba]|uniref:N-formylglutamate amidohydrolase n=1 Tax=Sphingomonas flavalba TaxID=2559804 RepID=UPI00109E0CF0|nr:N-formylglutamate amidohydrolase [Sphingomonas flavalba]